MGHFSLFKAKISYIYTLIPLKLTYFEEFYTFFSKSSWIWCYFLNVNSKNLEYLVSKLLKFCFTAVHSSVFGKVGELVGEIKYAKGAFDVKSLEISLESMIL